MADNLLSADELSALAEGVSDGSIAVDTGLVERREDNQG